MNAKFPILELTDRKRSPEELAKPDERMLRYLRLVCRVSGSRGGLYFSDAEVNDYLPAHRRAESRYA